MLNIEEDSALRQRCFAWLGVLRARFGEELPYRGGLDEGFPFGDGHVPFLTPYKGIFRAAAQRGPAALSIITSVDSPYGDAATDDGVLYAYRAGAIDQPDNRALRAAFRLQVPVVYFQATTPGWYRADYPCWVRADDPVARCVLVEPGSMVGPMDEPEPVLIEDPIERRYAVRQMHVRVYQAKFRGRVVPAYRKQCTICHLKEIRLLDAAHIVPDAEGGEPAVSNGLSLCSIHHRAFDENLVGISPDYTVHVARKLREDEDGPMLELLKGFHEQPIVLPARRAWQPDRERLALRFERFAAGA